MSRSVTTRRSATDGRRAGRAGRVDRLAVPARSRLAERFRGCPRRRSRRQLRAPARRSRGGGATLSARHQRASDDVHHRAGRGPGHRRDGLAERGLGPTRELIRRVDGLAGRVPIRWRITPAFGYGALSRRLERRGRIPVAVAGPRARGLLVGGRRAQLDEDAISGCFEARESSSALIALCAAHQEPLVFPSREQVEARLEATTAIGGAGLRSASTTGPGATP